MLFTYPGSRSPSFQGALLLPAMLLFFLLAGHLPAAGQTTLVPGDIAIVSFQSDNPDSFQFLVMTEILPGTQIHFTDNGWNSTSGAFRSGEGTFTWTADITYGCGDLVAPVVSGIALSASGDQIMAYQGTESSPVFINAINFGEATWSNALTTNDSALPPGLTNDTTAMAIANIDNGVYAEVSYTGTREEILARIHDPARWTTSNSPVGTYTQTVTVSDCSAGASLPVSMQYFRISAQGRQHLLSWATSGEKDNSYFAVERSTNGLHFREIGRLAADQHTATEGRSYRFVDPQPAAGVNYYRLRQVDSDGNFRHYGPRSLFSRTATADDLAYPNPVQSILNLPAEREARLFDLHGRPAGISLSGPVADLSLLPRGTWLLELTSSDGQRSFQRIIKN